MLKDPRSILTSVLIAVTADIAVAAIGGLTTPTRWLLARLPMLAQVPAARMVPVLAVLALMALNGWLLGHRLLDGEAPGIGRLVVFMVLGLPAALVQVSALTVAYLTLL